MITAEPLEGQGAFAEIDDSKLSRDGLVLRGMKMALDNIAQDLAVGAQSQTNPLIAQALMTVAQVYAQRADSVSVALVKSATRNGAGALQTFRKD
jgi:hypothetical protein